MPFRPAPHGAHLATRLRAFPFVERMGEAAREQLLAVARAQHFPDDAVLVRPAQRCPAVPLVERGAVRVVRSADKELHLYDVAPGQTCVLALSSVLRETPYQADATAVAGTDAILVPADDLRRLFHEDPALRGYVVDVFASRLADLMELAGEVAFDSIEARLARLLLREVEAWGDEVERSHAELAAMLGSAREVVSRVLEKMRRKGWVELARRRITVRDRQALADLANETTS